MLAAYLLSISITAAADTDPKPTPTAPSNHYELEEPVSEDIKSKPREETADFQSRILFKDGRFYEVKERKRRPEKLNPGQQRLADEQKRKQIEQLEETGQALIMASEPELENPGEVLYFDLPQTEMIPECTYTNGFTFPSDCVDTSGNRIFTAGRDPQSVLESLMIKHGITSKYNIVPKDYDPDLPIYPYPPNKIPLERLKELSDQFRKEHPEWKPPLE
jgi:hypothetical protein